MAEACGCRTVRASTQHFNSRARSPSTLPRQQNARPAWEWAGVPRAAFDGWVSDDGLAALALCGEPFRCTTASATAGPVRHPPLDRRQTPHGGPAEPAIRRGKITGLALSTAAIDLGPAVVSTGAVVRHPEHLGQFRQAQVRLVVRVQGRCHGYILSSSGDSPVVASLHCLYYLIRR
jgi:hypothetical protein